MKTQIVLHSSNSLKGQAAYTIDRLGQLIQNFSPEIAKEHIFPMGNHHKKQIEDQSIGIEILNLGPLHPATNTGYAKQQIAKAFCHDVNRGTIPYKGRPVIDPWKGWQNFEPWTDAQVLTTLEVLKMLGEHFSIPQVLLPEKLRFVACPETCVKFRGVLIHGNYRSRSLAFSPRQVTPLYQTLTR